VGIDIQSGPPTGTDVSLAPTMLSARRVRQAGCVTADGASALDERRARVLQLLLSG